MGMFDSLYVICPECGENIEFQSKSGNCNLEAYNIYNCDPRVAVDLDGESASCDHCGYIATLHVQSMITIQVE